MAGGAAGGGRRVVVIHAGFSVPTQPPARPRQNNLLHLKVQNGCPVQVVVLVVSGIVCWRRESLSEPLQAPCVGRRAAKWQRAVNQRRVVVQANLTMRKAAKKVQSVVLTTVTVCSVARAVWQARRQRAVG